MQDHHALDAFRQARTLWAHFVIARAALNRWVRIQRLSLSLEALQVNPFSLGSTSSG
jgi:hypothetical protein